MEQQLILLATDRHDGDNEPEQQWMTIQTAGAFLTSQLLPKGPPPKEVGTYLMSKEEWGQLRDLLWKYTNAIGWSKWDYRSNWYVKEVLPIGVDLPESEPLTMSALDGTRIFDEIVQEREALVDRPKVQSTEEETC